MQHQNRSSIIVSLGLAIALCLGMQTHVAHAEEQDPDARRYDPESMLVEVDYDLSSATTPSHDEPEGDEADDAEADEEQLELVTAADGTIEGIVANMTLDEKISQMIIPAIRTWNGTSVTTLPDGLASVLQRHQYGGLILFGGNMVETAQTARLVSSLQANNALVPASTNIPYLMCADGEGGLVVRLSTGTRMTGSMAVGATGDKATANAHDTGRILGEELAALGINVDFAPDADVNSNPSNPVIGTRSFSDDPQRVADLATAFAQGLDQSGVIGSYKHFPGHGDTGSDSHTGLTSVDKTYEELNASDLVPFRLAIAQGADLIMTAHIVLPNYDDSVILADGTEGFYPATMSPKIITGLLRGDLGYDGVVVTDALEMGAIVEGGLVPGGAYSLEYAINVAEKTINAGVDLLLIPTDLINDDKAAFYDQYIAAIAAKVESGEIPQERIDESVTRILTLKQKHGILNADPTAAADVDAALATVGSEEHRTTELRIAREAITLLKNDSLTLPLSGHHKKVVIAGRDKNDAATIVYALRHLQEIGLVPQDALIKNLSNDTTSGSAESKTAITVGSYYDSSTASVAYSDALKGAVAEADSVVVLTKNYGYSAMATSSAQYQGASQLIHDAHAAGASAVLLSNNLPYDAARYQDADAIVLSYLAAGLTDPTDATGSLVAYNANVVAAIEAIFDNMPPAGTLPVNVPAVVEQADGTVSPTSDMLYERGFGMTYDYQFTKGVGGKHKLGTSTNLTFTNNARYDLMTKVLVDGVKVSEDFYVASVGSTNITLKASYLNTLAARTHTLTTVHDYDTFEATPQATFTILKADEKPADDEEDDEEEQATKPANRTKTRVKKPNAKPAVKPAVKPLAKTGDIVTHAPLMAGMACALIVWGLNLRRRARR